MNYQELLEQIMAHHTEKQIVSLCKKCIKKLSFKSGSDVSNLSDLCFCLFIYNDLDAVLKLTEPTHNLVFDHNFSVWDQIHNIWALEVYILRKNNDVLGAEIRRNAIVENLRLPSDGESQEEHDRRESKLYNRINYDERTYRLNIEKAVAAGDKSGMTEWMLSALKNMIGCGETGLYPDFVAHNEQREKEIVQYADLLAGRETQPEPLPDGDIVVEKKLPKKFRDACNLILTDREQGVSVLMVPDFDIFAHQRDAVFAEIAYFDGDFEKALQLDMSICPWWGEWHYSNIFDEHIAAMTFAAFRLGREAELTAFFKAQITLEQSRTHEKKHIIDARVRGYENQIANLAMSYESLITLPRCSSLFSKRVKDGSPSEMESYAASGLWRVASVTQVRPMELFCDVWLYPSLTEQALRDIASAAGTINNNK